LEAENINTFYETLKNTFQNVLGTNVERGDLQKTQTSDLVDKTNIYIRINGDLTGHFYLSLPETTALQVVTKMAGMEADELNDFAKSALSEVANMVLGKASTQFHGGGIEINSEAPEVIADAGEDDINLFGETFILIPVTTDIGDLKLHIFLSE